MLVKRCPIMDISFIVMQIVQIIWILRMQNCMYAFPCRAADRCRSQSAMRSCVVDIAGAVDVFCYYLWFTIVIRHGDAVTQGDVRVEFHSDIQSFQKYSCDGRFVVRVPFFFLQYACQDDGVISIWWIADLASHFFFEILQLQIDELINDILVSVYLICVRIEKPFQGF